MFPFLLSSPIHCPFTAGHPCEPAIRTLGAVLLIRLEKHLQHLRHQWLGPQAATEIKKAKKGKKRARGNAPNPHPFSPFNMPGVAAASTAPVHLLNGKASVFTAGKSRSECNAAQLIAVWHFASRALFMTGFVHCEAPVYGAIWQIASHWKCRTNAGAQMWIISVPREPLLSKFPSGCHQRDNNLAQVTHTDSKVI